MKELLIPNRFSYLPPEHQEPQHKLDPHPPDHGPPLDMTRISREEESEEDDDKDAAERHQSVSVIPGVQDHEGHHGPDGNDVGQDFGNQVRKHFVQEGGKRFSHVFFQPVAEETDYDLEEKYFNMYIIYRSRKRILKGPTCIIK